MVRLDLGDHVADQPRMAVRGVDDDEVDTRLDQRLGPVVGVARDTHGGADDQPALGVLGGVRVLLGLDEVLDGDQALERAPAVHQRQLLDLVAAQQLHRGVPRDPDLAGDQRHRRHDIPDLAAAVQLEGHVVAVGDDAQELARGVGDRDATDAEPAAERVGLLEGGVGADGDGVGDHPGLGPLDLVDLVGLVLDREVAVQHAHAALPGHRDGHPALGDLVHGRGQQRHVDPHVARDVRRGVDVLRCHVRLAWQQQYVVVCQAQSGEFCGHSVDVLSHDTFPMLAPAGCPC